MFAWTDSDHLTPALRDIVLYELHAGTFTREGTFEAAIPHLRGLRELGVTAIELMPVAECPGRETDGWYEEFAQLGTLVKALGRPHVHDGSYSSFRGRRFGARMRELYAAALALRAEPAGEEAHAHADGRALTVRRGPYRILANFSDDPWPLDGEPVLTAGEVRDGALAPLAGAVVR